MDWKIYYGDATTFDSTMGWPQDSPALNVQGIIYRDTRLGAYNVGARVLVGADWYIYRPDLSLWFKCDEFGLYDQVIHYPGCVVRPGRAIGAQAYDELLQVITNDPDFRKDAYAPDEQREKQYR